MLPLIVLPSLARDAGGEAESGGDDGKGNFQESYLGRGWVIDGDAVVPRSLELGLLIGKRERVVIIGDERP